MLHSGRLKGKIGRDSVVRITKGERRKVLCTCESLASSVLSLGTIVACCLHVNNLRKAPFWSVGDAYIALVLFEAEAFGV